MTCADPLAKRGPDAYFPLMARQFYMDAEIRQNASLNATGLKVILGIVIAFNLVVGVGFFLAFGRHFGVGPVPVFLGLDVLAVWLAFRANNRAARRRERVRISAEQVEIWLESEAGRRTVWTSPTAFTGLDVEPWGQDDTKVRLRMHRRRYLVGRALSPGERADLGRALGDALRAARAERYPAGQGAT